MAPTTYADVLVRNIRAARTRLDIGQESLAARMRALGYDAWIRQTVGSTERGRRRPTAEEVFALSLALETSIAALMAPKDEDKIVDLPSGETVTVAAVQWSARGVLYGSVTWDGDTPVFAEDDPATLRMLDNVERPLYQVMQAGGGVAVVPPSGNDS
jgi:transcriptional regulator with XRE-family HTH domain